MGDKAILIRVVRDQAAVPHCPGEEVAIVGKLARGNFDPTELISVRFSSNGYRGMVRADEIADVGGMPIIGR